MLITCTPLSAEAATTAYVEPPISATATAEAPASSLNPPAPSMADATSAGEEGSVMFAMWMPPPLHPYGAAAITYVEAPEPKAAIPAPEPGVLWLPDALIASDADADGAVGSVMLMIWIARSPRETAAAYVPPPTAATATSMAPESPPKPPRPSTASEAWTGLYGSVTLTMRTPSRYHHTG